MHNPFHRFTKKQWIIVISVMILLPLLFFATDSRLLIRSYTVASEKIENPIRLVLITDLHSCYYGKNQETLLSAVEAQNPDLVLFSGDIFDENRDHTNALVLLSSLAKQYPCAYVSGNHEVWCGEVDYTRLMTQLQTEYGITVLHGDTVTVEINGTPVNLCGMDDPDAYTMGVGGGTQNTFSEQLQQLSEKVQTDSFTILLSHRPEYFETDYCGGAYDLVLSGHAHGGQVRIPGILNGLYAPHQGLFPPYAGGMYTKDGTAMIVSRGLARETTIVPRVFNRPELVVIDLT